MVFLQYHDEIEEKEEKEHQRCDGYNHRLSADGDIRKVRGVVSYIYLLNLEWKDYASAT